MKTKGTSRDLSPTMVLPAAISGDDLLVPFSKAVADAITVLSTELNGRRPIVFTVPEAIAAYKAVESLRAAVTKGGWKWQMVAKLKPHLEACKTMALSAPSLDEAVQCLQMARSIHKILKALEVPDQVKDVMLRAFKRAGVA